MATLDAWIYGDPFEVVARREAHEQRRQAACGACVHHLELIVNGKTMRACELGQHYGRRCESFKTKKGTI